VILTARGQALTPTLSPRSSDQVRGGSVPDLRPAHPKRRGDLPQSNLVFVWGTPRSWKAPQTRRLAPASPPIVRRSASRERRQRRHLSGRPAVHPKWTFSPTTACLQSAMLGTDLVAISRRDPDDSLIHGRLRSPVNGYLGEERSVSGDVRRAYFVAKKPPHGGLHLLPERRRLGRVGRTIT
jgi:hypothetical protein